MRARCEGACVSAGEGWVDVRERAARAARGCGAGSDTRDLLTYHPLPQSLPKVLERGGPRARLSWTWNFEPRGLGAPCAPCPLRIRPAPAPVGKGSCCVCWGETPEPRRPLPLVGFKEPLAAGRPGGRGGRSESAGPGGGGGETGGRRGGGRGEGRGGAARPAPLPNRKVGLAEVPPPRRAHSAPLRPRASEPAGRRRSPRRGREPGEERRSAGRGT